MSDNEEVDFFEEADTSTGAERFKADITNKVREFRQLSGKMDELKSRMKELALQMGELETKVIPDLMREAGVKEFTTLDGLKVSTKFIVGAIPAESKEMAYDWLDTHGHSDIIKRNLSLQFDKGATELAEQATLKLKELGFEPVTKLDVNAQTFMAFARNQITNGKMLPLDQWGCFYGDKAVIK